MDFILKNTKTMIEEVITLHWFLQYLPPYLQHMTQFEDLRLVITMLTDILEWNSV